MKEGKRRRASSFLLRCLVFLWLEQMASVPGIVSRPRWLVLSGYPCADYALYPVQSAFPESDASLYEWIGQVRPFSLLPSLLSFFPKTQTFILLHLTSSDRWTRSYRSFCPFLPALEASSFQPPLPQPLELTFPPSLILSFPFLCFSCSPTPASPSKSPFTSPQTTHTQLLLSNSLRHASTLMWPCLEETFVW